MIYIEVMINMRKILNLQYLRTIKQIFCKISFLMIQSFSWNLQFSAEIVTFELQKTVKSTVWPWRTKKLLWKLKIPIKVLNAICFINQNVLNHNDFQILKSRVLEWKETVSGIFFENKRLLQPDVVFDSKSIGRNFRSLAPPGGEKNIIFLFFSQPSGARELKLRSFDSKSKITSGRSNSLFSKKKSPLTDCFHSNSTSLPLQ